MIIIDIKAVTSQNLNNSNQQRQKENVSAYLEANGPPVQFVLFTR